MREKGLNACDIALFGGSFRPPGKHHRKIAERLAELFGSVFIVPCGNRADKSDVAVLPAHMRAMVCMAFRNLSRVELDFHDLEGGGTFTPTYLLDRRYAASFPGKTIWHVIGGDLVFDGRHGGSEIQRFWRHGAEIWKNLNFAVITHAGFPVNPADMPPHSMAVPMGHLEGRSTEIRDRIAQGIATNDLLDAEIEAYIKKNGLFRSLRLTDC